MRTAGFFGTREGLDPLASECDMLPAANPWPGSVQESPGSTGNGGDTTTCPAQNKAQGNGQGKAHGKAQGEEPAAFTPPLTEPVPACKACRGRQRGPQELRGRGRACIGGCMGAAQGGVGGTNE